MKNPRIQPRITFHGKQRINIVENIYENHGYQLTVGYPKLSQVKQCRDIIPDVQKIFHSKTMQNRRKLPPPIVGNITTVATLSLNILRK